jgi:hypothetical protein
MPKKDNLTREEKIVWLHLKVKDQSISTLCMLIQITPQVLRGMKERMTKKGYPITSTRDRGYFAILTKKDKLDAREYHHKLLKGHARAIARIDKVMVKASQRTLFKNNRGK